MEQKLESPLEEEIKDQEKEYLQRIEEEIKKDSEKSFVDKKAVREICCFKAVAKMHKLKKR